MGASPATDVSALIATLQEATVLTLATRATDGWPHTAPVYYAMSADLPPALVLASAPDSAHGTHVGRGPAVVAGAVHIDHRDVTRLRGVQMRGQIAALERWPQDRATALRSAYLDRFPPAAELLATGRHRLYGLAVTAAKLTDNARLGLGNHAHWVFPPPWEVRAP